MLRTILVASTVLAGFGSAALAADLPRRTVPYAPVAVPAFTWTGFYVGGHAGYINSDSNTITTTGNNTVTAGNVLATLRPPGIASQTDGFIGGGQIGYNHQIGIGVFGIEADISSTDLNERDTFLSNRAGANPTDRSVFRSRLDYLGTVRGRFGIAFDRVLVYGTGGFAYGEVRQDVDFFAFNSGLLQFTGRNRGTETGYAVGGGVEYAISTDSFLNVFNVFGSDAVTIRGEYLYYNLGSQSVTVAGVPGVAAAASITGYTSRFETDGHIARAGINFKFGTY